MPPTAIEIKARLDKSVDKEGNVLNMEAVLDIVATLEKLSMTEEELQTTRIGWVINLMRKKTTNVDLSRRAKQLVKKWQTLVTNHLKKTLKSDSPINISSGQLNGVVKRTETDRSNSRPGSRNERQSAKKVLKRKLQNSPLNAVSSPKHKVSSPMRNHSPSSLIASSPSSVSSSPKLTSRPNTTSNLTSKGRKSTRSPVNKLTCLTTDNATTIINNRNSSLSSTVQASTINQNLPSEQKKDLQSLTYIINNGHSSAPLIDIVSEKPTDTRLQENRIDTSTNNNIIKTDTYNTELKNKETLIENLTEYQNINSSVQNLEYDKQEFENIEAEDLALIRKELPEDIITPDTEADGINGVYNEENNWYGWLDIVPQRNNEFHLLPYVILD